MRLLSMASLVFVVPILTLCPLSTSANAGDVREAVVEYSETSGTSTVTVPWSPPFSDTNYTAVCTAETTPSDFLLPVITLRSAASMNVNPEDTGSLLQPATGKLHCIAIPDSDSSDIRHRRVPFSAFPPAITVSWIPAFPDINYTVVCTVETQQAVGDGFTSAITALSPGAVSVSNNGFATGTMHCIAIPDSDSSEIRHSRVSITDNPMFALVTWTAPFSDANYAAVCSDEASGDLGNDSAIAIYLNSTGLASMTVIPEIGVGTVQCIGVPSVELLDPVPSLLSGSGIVQVPSVLASSGTPVAGAAADGVAQVVVRIPSAHPGGKIQLTLNNDQRSPSDDPTHDGYLTSLDGSQSTKMTDPITVGVDAATSMAFAIYHSPVDFARPSNLLYDATAVMRKVAIQVQDGNTIQTQEVEIVRPPVLFIHGLWSDESTWNEFDSAMKAAIPGPPKLPTYRIDYKDSHGDSIDFNTLVALVIGPAPVVDDLSDFKKTYDVAAAQFDFIAHSMGGLISDEMPRFSALFRSQQTFGQGYIHKLITIDTPYEGSPIAAGLDQSSAACKLIINQTGNEVDGAIHDLVPGSDFYSQFNPTPTGYYKHAIASSVTEAQSTLASIGVDGAVLGISVLGNPATRTLLAACYSVFVTPATASPPPPLFSFDLFFGGSNDLIVSTASQLGPFVAPFAESNDTGVAHLHVAIPFLNLTLIPGALDQVSGNPAQAITLLNSDVNGGSFLK